MHQRSTVPGPDAERYRGLLHLLPDGVFVTDADGRLVTVNPALAALLGCREEELLGRRLTDFLAPGEGGLAAPAGEREVETALLLPDDQERVVRIRAAPLVEGGRIVGQQGIVRDLSGQRRAEAALREREEQLRHAQKLEAVGRLAGGIAHDFNNLLMVIRGSVNLILMDPIPGTHWKVDLEEILHATERAAALTQQLLAFSRKQVLRPRVLDVNAAVQELRRAAPAEVGGDVELVTELEPDLWPVRVDPEQLQQVVLSLVANAREAMPGGGRITIRTSNAELTPEDARRLPYRVVPGEYVRLVVEDTGIGMPESVRSRVFEPFFTTKGQGNGAGLGLSMVYGIVKQSGGYIWASSVPGEGSTFEIYLPRADAPAERNPRQAGAREARTARTILLVEDEEPVRAVTRRFLEHGGYRVLEAGSGAEALRLFEQFQDSIDLLLTDVVMPGMSGRELATRVLAQRPALKVLYVSGYADDRRLRQGAGAAADDFIQKPYDLGGLLERVRGMLGR